jgi:deferrochelatase/peroxidase EfeB
VFAVSDEALPEAVDELQLAGCSVVASHHAHRLNRSDYEHFGYRDGISQPTLDGVEPRIGLKDPLPPVPARAVVLGPDSLEPPGISEPMPSIGLNGSFAAFRMMHQDVAAFEAFLVDAAARNDVDPELVAAKICGRWRNGDPLMLRLEPDGEIPHHDRNHFDYETTEAFVGGDREGLVCPRGAHIRRAFPRSQRVIDDLTGLHRRIVRRAMPYGPRWREDEPDGIERGLVGYFICASLEHQFEYVMRNWINDGLFTGGRLGRARDPLTGAAQPEDARFHAPGTLEATDIPQFVTTRGCLYLFLPGLAALAELAA